MGVTGDRDCPHCAHYQIVASQLFDTAIDLDQAEGEVARLRERLKSAVEALVWCMAHIDEQPAPGWVQDTLYQAEAAS